MTKIVPVQSSAPGSGNKLVSTLRTGYVVTADRRIELFRFNSSDARAFAEFMTNLPDVGRIGNSWDFEGRSVFIRAVKTAGSIPTAAELQDMKAYLSSLDVVIVTGQERRPQLKVSGLQLSDPQEFASSNTVNPTSQKGEVGLPVPILIERGWEIGGSCSCTLPAVPSSLYAENQTWVILIGLVGFEQTY